VTEEVSVPTDSGTVGSQEHTHERVAACVEIPAGPHLGRQRRAASPDSIRAYATISSVLDRPITANRKPSRRLSCRRRTTHTTISRQVGSKRKQGEI
jgi:hypothetical protein